ncbi:MAG: flagellar basal body rod protein FlgC [Pyrinomonadaceae bacterium]
MSVYTIFQIASQGMTAQRERLEAATSNLANANATRTAEGGPYRRRDVVFETVAADARRDAATSSGFIDFGDEQGGESTTPVGVRAQVQVADANAFVKRFQPDHPDADAEGYVQMPDVDPLEETVNMISAARSFEASATAFNTAKEMARASLRLGDA